MRTIHLARLEKTRPVVVLTRESVRPYRNRLTVASITSTIRGSATEIPVGRDNGLDHDSVVNCDNITTIPASDLGQQIGFLLDSQEDALVAAIHAAFDLDAFDR
ncbi:MAG: type II toxin-antitoxin system PemK/MazF family toxin [Rhodoglobus sp.]